MTARAAPLLVAFALAGPAGAADRALGERIVVSGGGDRVTACATCHGAGGGESHAPAFGALAGRRYEALRDALADYAEGRREHPIMTVIAQAMTPAQRAATAAFYASRPRPR